MGLDCIPYVWSLLSSFISEVTLAPFGIVPFRSVWHWGLDPGFLLRVRRAEDLHRMHSPLAGSRPPWSRWLRAQGLCSVQRLWMIPMVTYSWEGKYKSRWHGQSWLKGNCKFRVVLEPDQPIKKTGYLLPNVRKFSLLNWKWSYSNFTIWAPPVSYPEYSPSQDPAACDFGQTWWALPDTVSPLPKGNLEGNMAWYGALVVLKGWWQTRG